MAAPKIDTEEVIDNNSFEMIPSSNIELPSSAQHPSPQPSLFSWASAASALSNAAASASSASVSTASTAVSGVVWAALYATTQLSSYGSEMPDFYNEMNSDQWECALYKAKKAELLKLEAARKSKSEALDNLDGVNIF